MNVTKDIKYIGVDDPTLTLFEGQYHLPAGMCYNSYVIEDDDIAVFDTSDVRTLAPWEEKLKAALGDRKPTYLIIQHMEPDHSAGIKRMLDLYPEVKIVASAKAVQMLPLYFEGVDLEGRAHVVKEGDTLCLGKHTLRFINAPMVHWPEVIMTYDETDKALFSADGFGKFGVYDADRDDWACEARRYYFNICGKYGVSVQQVLKKAAKLDIQRILPLHGPILEGEAMTTAVKLYDTWSKYDVETPGVLIACASIHGGTLCAAQYLQGLLEQRGAGKVVLTDLTTDDQAEAIEDAFRMSHLVCCASSYDAGVFPPMHDFIYHLGIKGYQRRKVALVENGSWAPTAAKVMREMFAPMKNITLVEPSITIRGRMHEADKPAFEALADTLAADFK